MSSRGSLTERVDQEIKSGRLWRAKEILQGNISVRGYDSGLYELYGTVLLRMGDLLEAGKYLFLSAVRKPDYEEPIRLFLSRYTRKDSSRLYFTFPKAARLKRLADYPHLVAEELAALGLAAPALTVEQASQRKIGLTQRVLGIGCVLALFGALALMGLGVLFVGQVLTKRFGGW
jgi:hypothetical protein